jgi:hypothetical protein
VDQNQTTAKSVAFFTFTGLYRNLIFSVHRERSKTSGRMIQSVLSLYDKELLFYLFQFLWTLLYLHGKLLGNEVAPPSVPPPGVKEMKRTYP